MDPKMKVITNTFLFYMKYDYRFCLHKTVASGHETPFI